MLSTIIALAPLILKFGGFLIDLVYSDKAKREEQKKNLQAWLDAKKNEGQTSAAQHLNYEAQMQELLSELTPEEREEFKWNELEIAMGDQNKVVEILKRKLKAAGFDTGSEGPMFDLKTATTLKAFQVSRRLSADGIAGKETWAALAQY